VADWTVAVPADFDDEDLGAAVPEVNAVPVTA